MQLLNLLPLAAIAAAFVIPDDQVMSQIAIESQKSADSASSWLPSKDQLQEEFDKTSKNVLKFSKNALDDAYDHTAESFNKVSQKAYETGFDAQSWLHSASSSFVPEGHHGHHGHGKPNLTIYELIAKSKYTTRLAGLINEYPDLVTLLNGTSANYTLFAPIDSAFGKIPEDAPKPSKEDFKKVLLYHVSPEYYPAGKVLVTHTVPSALTVDTVGIGPQRLSTNIGLKGLTVNFYSRIVAIDIVRIGYRFSSLLPSLIWSVRNEWRHPRR